MQQKKLGLLNRYALFLISLYQKTISPDKSPLFSPFLAGKICTHEPHCSAYAKECFHKYNFLTASHYSMERIISCGPAQEKSYDPSSYRVVLFSSSPIGIPFLQSLHDDPRFDLVGVVTMPDAPVGRGMQLQENVIKKEARKLLDEHLENSQTIMTPRSLRLDSKKYATDAQQFQERVTALQPDLFVVIAYGHIMPQRVLDIPYFGPINIHGSLLPAYRGASPLQSVFLDEQEETGITIMHMDAGVDTGPMIQKIKTKISPEMTVIDLITRIKEKTPHMVNTILRDRAKGLLSAEVQDEQKATGCCKFVKEDGLIDPFTDDAREVWKKRQAFALWPKLYFFLDEKRFLLDGLQLKPGSQKKDIQGASLFTSYAKPRLHDRIAQIKITPEGKKSLTREEFMHGYLLKK